MTRNPRSPSGGGGDQWRGNLEENRKTGKPGTVSYSPVASGPAEDDRGEGKE